MDRKTKGLWMYDIRSTPWRIILIIGAFFTLAGIAQAIYEFSTINTFEDCAGYYRSRKEFDRDPRRCLLGGKNLEVFVEGAPEPQH